MAADFYLEAHDILVHKVGRFYAPKLTTEAYMLASKTKSLYEKIPFRDLFFESATLEIIRHLASLKKLKIKESQNLNNTRRLGEDCIDYDVELRRVYHCLNSFEKLIAIGLIDGKSAEEMALTRGVSVDLVSLFAYSIDEKIRNGVRQYEHK